MDDDLEAMSREQLMAEVRKLRAGIREHRDSSGQGLCWHHPKCGACCPKEPIPCPWCRSGLNSWQVA